MSKRTKLFTGTSNRPLAAAVSDKLQIPLERVDIGRFADGEIHVELKDNVRGCKAFIIHPTCAPANDTLMELNLLADAIHRSSAKKIIAIIPYYGYARQDRRPGYKRSPISARVVADLIQAVHIDHLVTIDLHAIQIQGFFNIPVDNLSANRLFVEDFRSKYAGLENFIVVSPDIGGVGRARALAKYLDNCDLAIVDKRRPKPNVSEVMNIIGDVEGKVCIITDDMIDTAGTLAHAADALMMKGATKVIAYCTHGVLSGNAYDNIQNSALSEVIVTDTIPLKDTFAGSKVRQVSVAGIIAETISRLNAGTSISELSN